MASPVTLWLQGVSQDIQRRLDRAEALAREDLVETHALLARDLVVVLAPRMPFDEAIDRYIETMELDGDEAEPIGTRAVALMDEREVSEDLAREGHRGWGWDWRYATPMGALRYIRRHKQRSDEESLWLELAAARAEETLVTADIRFAMEFVELMEQHQHADPSRAVAHYVERLDLPEMRARMVYQRALARLADDLLPRLPEE